MDDDKIYEWKDAGWTTCTSSCLGGIQETKIICIESETGVPASPIYCGRTKQRPDVIGIIPSLSIHGILIFHIIICSYGFHDPSNLN